MRGLLVDFGGVLTTDVFASFEAFCRAEGLDGDHVKQLFRSDSHARGLLEKLETGALSEAEFERAFGQALGVSPDDLIARLFAGIEPDAAMVAAVRRAREQGIVTGLLSNSFGRATDYDGIGAIFDARVISAEVGMRKPAKQLGMATVLHSSARETISGLEPLLGVKLGGAAAA